MVLDDPALSTMNELLRCRITANASYDPRSAEIIARNTDQQCRATFKIIIFFSVIQKYIISF